MRRSVKTAKRCAPPKLGLKKYPIALTVVLLASSNIALATQVNPPFSTTTKTKRAALPEPVEPTATDSLSKVALFFSESIPKVCTVGEGSNQTPALVAWFKAP